MVTKRARRWLTRAALVGSVVVSGTLAVSAWSLAGSISETLLEFPPRSTAVEVVAIDDDTVTLRAAASVSRPGRWALVGEDAWVEVGPVVATAAGTVTRQVIAVSGRPGGTMRIEAEAYGPDPGAMGIEFDERIVAGSGGDHSVWTVEGTGTLWVVMVHDGDTGRTQALRALETVVGMGLPAVVPAMLGADGAPEGGRPGLGAAEWRDVEAAIGLALSLGAEEVVLMGWGTGASAALVTARQSRHAPRVAALVLEDPLLDPGSIAEARLREDKVPGFLIGWSKAVAVFRFGIDWDRLDHLAVAADQTLPTLLIHGSANDRHPPAATEAYAAAAPEAVAFVVPGAGHGEAWNVDPDRYRATLEEFLAEVVAGRAQDDPESD